MRTLRLSITSIVLFFTLFTLQAEAKTLYVDPNGDDSVTYEDNSSSAPWRTIGRAAWGSTNRSTPNTNQAARAGDIVLVSEGTYTTTGTGDRFNPAFNPVNSGTLGNPITFQCVTSRSCYLQFSSGVGPVMGAAGKNYITWKGFYIDEANAVSTPDTGPVTLSGTVGSTIEDSTIIGRGNINRNDNYPGIRIEWATDITIRNNRISNFQSGINSPAIQLYRSGRGTFENNEIFNVGSGIAIKGTAEPEWNDWFIVRYNLMYDIGVAGVWVHRVASPPYINIYQNIIRDSGSGVMIHNFGDWTEPQNVKVFNNTLYNNTSGFIVQWNSVAANPNHLIQNNIITNSTQAAINFSDMTLNNVTTARYLFKNNLYSGNSAFTAGISNYSLSNWQTQLGQDIGSVNANPLFVSSTDFRLQASSPARTVGRAIYGVGGSDGTTIPAGAYITGNEVIGLNTSGTSNPPPPPPPLPPSDTTPPTISLSSPTGTVSGTVTISASASDNVSVAGVQFRINGVNQGSEDTTSPYSITWNTTTLTNGTYTISAVARDSAGNTTTSSNTTVTVNNTVTPEPPPSDTTPPTISSISVSNITTTGATITYTTNETTTSNVQYGLTSSYGNTALSGGTITHTVTLSNLTPNTTYNYRISATDTSNNNTVSSNQTFTTSQVVVTPPPTTPTPAPTPPPSNTPTPTQPPEPAPQPKPTPTQPDPKPTTPTVPKPKLTRTVYIGSKGDDVASLQTFLINTGYLAPNLNTGYFGPATREAVQKYQCTNLQICSGTESTTGYGMVGQRTRASISSINISSTPTLPTTPTTPTSTLTPEQRAAIQKQINDLLLLVQQLLIQLRALQGN